MLALFFQLNRPVLVSGEQEGYSLSRVPWRQARVESCSKMLLAFKGEKHESQLVVPLGYFRAAPSLHHCPCSAPLPPCTISRVIKDRQARSAGSEDRAGGCKEGFSFAEQTPRDVTEPQGRYQLLR